MFKKLLLFSCLALSCLGAKAAYVPVVVTGYNFDGVCNGAGTAASSTSGSFDGQGYYLTDSTFVHPTYGVPTVPCMPTSLSVTSAQDPQLQWTLKPYNQNNVLRITNIATDSMVLTTPTSAGEVYILYTNVVTGSYGTVNVTLNFTDGTTQAATSFTNTPNWFYNASAPGTLAKVIGGRLNDNSGGGYQSNNSTTGGPLLYQFKVTVLPANYTKSIRSIKFDNATTGNILNVFAVTVNTVCSGTVTAGSVVSSAGNSVCPSVAFTLSVPTATAGVGITYQWQSSPTGSAPWTNMGTAATQSATQTAATYYRCYIRCNSGTADTSTALNVIMKPANQCYCIPAASSNTYFIANFTTTGGTLNVNNTTGGGITSLGYSDYTGTQTVSAMQTTTVNFSTTGSSGHTFVWRVFVDWNQNGIFDAAEQMFTNGTTYTNGVTGSFTVPITATPGLTRMRVFGDYYSSTGAPCTFSTTGPSGEAEDYAFNVIALPPCSGAPTAGTSTAQPAIVCSGNSTNLSLSGNALQSGLSYQWQTSPTLAGTYTNVGPSSGGFAYTATAITATAYYRCQVTCGTNISYSTPVLVTVPGLFPAGTYTINSALATGGTNYQTFAAAVAAVQCGIAGPVIFNVATGSGPYNEQIEILNISTTSATNTITFNCNNTTLTFLGTATAPHTLGLNGADYLRFNNLNVVGTSGTDGIAGHLWNDANNNIFTNCSFSLPVSSTSTTNSAFAISGSITSPTTSGLSGSNNLLTGCTMTSGYYCVSFYGNSAAVNTGNQMINCNVKDYYAYGSYNAYNKDVVLSGNNFERPTRTSLTSFYGIYLTTGCINALIEKNRIHDGFATTPTTTSATYAIYVAVDGTLNNENKVYNNLIYNIQSSGTVYGLYLLGADYIKAYHNTINMDHAGATAGTIYSIYNSGTVGGIDIKDNIVSLNRGGTGTKYGLYFTTAMPVSNYNNIYVNSPAGTNYFGYNGTAQATLANWQTATSQDANTTTVDPQFTAAATGNLQPLNLAFNNTGTPVGVTNDILGATRSTTVPDKGAYEFGDVPPLCISAPLNPVNGSTTTCSGVTRLSWNKQPGAVNYDVYLNTGTAAPTTIVSTSQIDTFLNVSTIVGPYTWKVTPKNIYGAPTACSFWTFSTVFSAPTSVSTTVSPNDTVCVGDVPLFTAIPVNGGPAPSYQWKKNGINVGTNSPTYAAAGLNTGDYIKVVMTSNATGCKTDPAPVSDSTRMVLQTVPPAIIAATGPVAFCSGGSVRLQASTVGTSYQWIQLGSNIPGATNSYFDAQYSGWYRIKVNGVGTNICPAYSDSIKVTVYNSPFPLVNRNGNVLSTASFYSTYQWYFNGTAIPGATTNSITITRDGGYVVKVNDTSGCNGTSVVTPVNSMSVGSVSASDVSVYPNPAHDVVYITSPVKLNIAIRSIDGKLIIEQKNATSVNVSQLAQGIYIMYLSDEKQNLIKTEKIVKSMN